MIELTTERCFKIQVAESLKLSCHFVEKCYAKDQLPQLLMPIGGHL